MKKIILLLSMLVSVNGFANETLDLGNWIDNEIELSKSSLVNIEENTNNYDITLKSIMFRVRISYGVSIPFLAKAKVKPEIEFFWTK